MPIIDLDDYGASASTAVIEPVPQPMRPRQAAPGMVQVDLSQYGSESQEQAQPQSSPGWSGYRATQEDQNKLAQLQEIIDSGQPKLVEMMGNQLGLPPELVMRAVAESQSKTPAAKTLKKAKGMGEYAGGAYLGGEIGAADTGGALSRGIDIADVAGKFYPPLRAATMPLKWVKDTFGRSPEELHAYARDVGAGGQEWLRDSFGRHIMGATSSLVPMVAGIPAGGWGGLSVMGGVVASAEYENALKAGKSKPVALIHGMAQGLIEAGMEVAGLKLGKGFLSAMTREAKEAAARGIRPILTAIGADALFEVGQENITSLLQQFASNLADVDPADINPLTEEGRANIWKMFKDTTIQALLLSGLGGAKTFAEERAAQKADKGRSMASASRSAQFSSARDRLRSMGKEPTKDMILAEMERYREEGHAIPAAPEPREVVPTIEKTIDELAPPVEGTIEAGAPPPVPTPDIPPIEETAPAAPPAAPAAKPASKLPTAEEFDLQRRLESKGHKKIVSNLIADEGLSQDQAERIALKEAQRAMKSHAVDPTSGWEDARGKDRAEAFNDYIKVAQDVSAKGEPTVLLNVDMHNQGGMNAAEGEKTHWPRANKHINTMLSFLRDEAEKLGATGRWVRIGSDEYRAVLAGLSEKQAREVVEAAQKRMYEYASTTRAENGQLLSEIPHAKTPNDLTQRGFGVIVGVKEITPDESVSKLLAAADKDLDNLKAKGVYGEPRSQTSAIGTPSLEGQAGGVGKGAGGIGDEAGRRAGDEPAKAAGAPAEPAPDEVTTEPVPPPAPPPAAKPAKKPLRKATPPSQKPPDEPGAAAAPVPAKPPPAPPAPAKTPKPLKKAKAPAAEPEPVKKTAEEAGLLRQAEDAFEAEDSIDKIAVLARLRWNPPKLPPRRVAKSLLNKMAQKGQDSLRDTIWRVLEDLSLEERYKNNVTDIEARVYEFPTKKDVKEYLQTKLKTTMEDMRGPEEPSPEEILDAAKAELTRAKTEEEVNEILDRNDVGLTEETRDELWDTGVKRIIEIKGVEEPVPFSIASAKAPGQRTRTFGTQDALRGAIQKEAPHLTDDRFTILDHPNELPRNLRMRMRLKGYDARSVEAAVAEDGHVYFIRQNLAPQRLAALIKHETIGHGVIRALGRKASDSIMEQLANAMDAKEKARISKEYKLDLSDKGQRVELADEFLGKAAENYQTDPTLWQRVVATVRQVLRNYGIVKEFSDNDIRALLYKGKQESIRPKKSLKKGEFKGPEFEGEEYELPAGRFSYRPPEKNRIKEKEGIRVEEIAGPSVKQLRTGVEFGAYIDRLAEAKTILARYNFEFMVDEGGDIEGIKYIPRYQTDRIKYFYYGSDEYKNTLYGEVRKVADEVIPFAQDYHKRSNVPIGIEAIGEIKRDRSGLSSMANQLPASPEEMATYKLLMLRDENRTKNPEEIQGEWTDEPQYLGHAQVYEKDGKLIVFEMQPTYNSELKGMSIPEIMLRLSNGVKEYMEKRGLKSVVVMGPTSAAKVYGRKGPPGKTFYEAYGKGGLVRTAMRSVFGNPKRKEAAGQLWKPGVEEGEPLTGRAYEPRQREVSDRGRFSLAPKKEEQKPDFAGMKARELKDAAKAVGIPLGKYKRSELIKQLEKGYGRPYLANIGETPEVRQLMNQTDQERKEAGLPGVRHQADRWSEAERRLAADYEGERKELFLKLEHPENGLNDTETAIARLIVNRETLGAIASGDPARILEAQKLRSAYRQTRSETARAMSMGQDLMQSPAERMRIVITDAIMEPSPKLDKDMDRARQDGDWAKLEELNKKAVAEVQRMREILKKNGIDPDSLEELAEIAAKPLRSVTQAQRSQKAAVDPIEKAVLDAIKELEPGLASMPKPGKGPRPIRQRSAIGKITESMAKAALANLDRSLADLGAMMRRKGLGANPVLDPEVISVAGKITAQAITAGVTKFADLSVRVVEIMGDKLSAQVLPLMQQIWDKLRAKPGFEDLESVEGAPKILGPLKPVPASSGRETQAKLPGTAFRGSGGLVPVDPRYDLPFNLRPLKPVPASSGRETQAKLPGTERPARPWPKPTMTPEEAQVKLSRAVQELAAAKSSGGSMTYEYWQNAILSGPQTHAKNIAGNTLFGTWNMFVERGLEAAISKGLKSMGLKSNAASIDEIKAVYNGLLPNLGKAWANSVMTWKTEIPWFDITYGGKGEAKFGQGRAAIPGTAGRVIRSSWRALGAEDAFFKTLIANAEVGVQALRIAKAEGLSGDKLSAKIAKLTRNPWEDPFPDTRAWAAATEKARELTFTEEPHELVKSMHYIISHVPGLRWVVPFVSTPGNILRQGLRRIPGSSTAQFLWHRGEMSELPDRNLIKALYHGYKTGDFAKVPEPAARAVIAYGLLAGLAMTISGDDKDWITGTEDSMKYAYNKAVKDKPPPYSVRIFGRWVSYSGLDPLHFILGTLVDAAKGMKTGRMSDAIMGLAGQLENKSYMDGLSNLFEVLNAIPNGWDATSNKALDFVARIGSQFVAPNIVQWPLRTPQSTIKERGVYGKGLDKTGMVLKRAAQRTELLGLFSEEYPAVDLWGRPALRDLFGTRPEKAPILGDRIILDYNMKHLDEPYRPTLPQRQYTVNGKQKYMNDAQYHRFLTESGQLAATMVENELSASDLSIDDKQERLKEIVKKAHRLIKAQIVDDAGDKAHTLRKLHRLKRKQ